MAGEERMAAAPLFSIVITNYNYGRFVSRAIESALDQDYPGLEVLVVDDGSTDASLEIIRAYDRVRLLEQENAGQAAAVNLGFRESAGQFLVFLDADDMMTPGSVRRFAEAFEDDLVCRVQGYLQCVDEQGRALERVIPGTVHDTVGLLERVVRHGPGSYVCTPSSGNAWRRSFLDAIMPLPVHSRAWMDQFLNDVAPLHGTVAGLDRPVVGYYRVHGTSVSDDVRPITADNVRQVMGRHEMRRAFLAAAAQRKGLVCDPGAWTRRNWRLAALGLVLTSLEGRRRPGWTSAVLQPAVAARGPMKKLQVASFLSVLKLAPARLVPRITASRIRLDFM